MLGSDGMDFTLECVVPGARRFQLLHPIMTGA
jgi:hypothetical protein